MREAILNSPAMQWVAGHWPFFTILMLTGVGLLYARRRLRLRRSSTSLEDQRLLRRTVLSLLGLTGFALALATLDMENHFLAVVGIIISGGLALASTPLLSNVMAGAMLLFEETYRPGDILEFGEHSGRVTQVRLLYTELQTEDRDLMRVPNLRVVSQPVKVVHADGTIISCTVSLGYDTPRNEIERVLEMAALAAELRDPAVQIIELGDHSITYRVAGVLKDVQVLVTAQSNLRKIVIDMLHGAGIEVVSPIFMNQRPVPADKPVIPGTVAPEELSLATAADHIFFPDAERASKIVRLAERVEKTKKEIEILQAENAERGAETLLAVRIERKQRHVERLEMVLKGLEREEG